MDYYFFNGYLVYGPVDGRSGFCRLIMRIWQLAPPAPDTFIAAHSDIAPRLLQLLYNRGIRDEAALKIFWREELDQDLALLISGSDGKSESGLVFYNPFLFKDMEAAADLIISHIKRGDKILVYGDYDADGVTSSVITLETLKILKAQADVYLPDRVSEGYGLNQAALDQLKEQGFKLIVTVDNGVRNFKEVEYATSIGLEIIVTDHHVLPEKETEIPACLLINPADSRNGYPWPYLAGVGTAFKLVTALLVKADLPWRQKELILEKSLDLVAVGTIADMVSLLGENRLLVRKGLEVLNRRKRLGLNELLKASKISEDRKIEAWNVGWQIGPRLNAASRIAHANSAFALLTTENPEEAKELANELNQRNIERQEITAQISAQVEEGIDPENLPPIIIGLAKEDQAWNEGVIGLVAGRICEKYYRPTLIITRIIEEAEFDPLTNQLVTKKVSFKGSGRSIEELNLIAAIEECSANLDKYGGHPMACGFSISSEDKLELFSKQLTSIVAKSLAGKELFPKLKIEVELELKEISLEFIEEINKLAPFGQNNPQPRFSSSNLVIEDIMTMGFDNQHIKIRLAQGQHSFWALAFSAASDYKHLQRGDTIDLAYSLDINEFNGRREPQLKIADIKLKS